MTKPVIVLKFGGSVLRGEESVASAVSEIYRYVRQGSAVVAVVSAFHGETDRLLRHAATYGAAQRGRATPYLVALGETRSAALLALAAERVGLQTRLRPPHEIGLRAGGDRHDASPVDVDTDRLRRDLDEADVVVVPGFVAVGEHGETVLLGRGGTDLSAVFLAARLGARVRLLKDVDGVYDRDPALNRAGARPFARITWAEAERLAHPLVQDKAVRLAAAVELPIEVAALGAAYETVIGPDTAVRIAAPPAGEALRVALLGCGVVGGGVLERLLDDPERFEPVAVLVRDVGRRAWHRAGGLFTDEVEELASADADVLVDTGCGLEPSSDLIEAYLARGGAVVSANKQAVNAARTRFAAAIGAGGGRLLHSAAVGGGAPFLEAAARCRPDGVVGIEGVVNGTCNFVLERLAEGLTLDAAVHAATRAGFAEADPSADLEGRDAAAKLELLARAAAPDAPFVFKGADVLDASVTTPAQGRLKQVARAVLGPHGWTGEVRLVALLDSDFLAGAEAEENRLRLTLADGRQVHTAGKGAGRWPTVEAVMADLYDLRREGRAAAVSRTAPRAKATAG
ncbi:homoserine dehydrogenase [Caulobacter sp. 17J80-11]|uniref:amino acid kinase family protein n=1 Tax=Caulobacter sp. 17J80-11 TaxID=2763502 RepID=UPI0016534FA7|nr:homoserine dehydrogenase [Caulobacter sp. 17J80-11]